MKSIYKYPLSVEDKQVIQLPVGSEILTVQLQNNNSVLWAMVNVNDSRLVSRHIVMFETGKRIDMKRNFRYISTFKIPIGLVFHVFEELN